MRAAGGERCEDLDPLREDAALALLSGTACRRRRRRGTSWRSFDEAAPPLWQGETGHVPGEGERLQGLTAASRRLLGFLQERRPATIDLDATILDSQKQSAKASYDGRRGISR